MSSEGQLDIPKPTIKRIVKEKLSAAGCGEGGKGDVQLNKEALLAFAESAKVFISYITAAANDICKDKKRATLNADDIFAALEELEFHEMLPELKEAYEAYKQSTKEKKEMKAVMSRKRKSALQAPGDTAAATPAEENDADTKAAADNSQEAAADEGADANAVAGTTTAADDGDKADDSHDADMPDAEPTDGGHAAADADDEH